MINRASGQSRSCARGVDGQGATEKIKRNLARARITSRKELNGLHIPFWARRRQFRERPHSSFGRGVYRMSMALNSERSQYWLLTTISGKRPHELLEAMNMRSEIP